MDFDTLIVALRARRYSGDWQIIAKSAGIDYSTLVRIIRGETSDPSVRTVERIKAAYLLRSQVTS